MQRLMRDCLGRHPALLACTAEVPGSAGSCDCFTADPDLPGCLGACYSDWKVDVCGGLDASSDAPTPPVLLETQLCVSRGIVQDVVVCEN